MDQGCLVQNSVDEMMFKNVRISCDTRLGVSELGTNEEIAVKISLGQLAVQLKNFKWRGSGVVSCEIQD